MVLPTMPAEADGGAAEDTAGGIRTGPLAAATAIKRKTDK
jgi:hypothetical protein